MPGPYDIDTQIQVSVSFANTFTGAPADPSTVTLYLTDPHGNAQTLVGPIVRDGVGQYHYTFTPAVSGVWTYKWQGTGAVIITSPDTQFTVRSSALIAG